MVSPSVRFRTSMLVSGESQGTLWERKVDNDFRFREPSRLVDTAETVGTSSPVLLLFIFGFLEKKIRKKK
jgi:hypothetical protein